jgi:DNA/RNA-binding domain of Phe-tRNA-synthetase-like protein
MVDIKILEDWYHKFPGSHIGMLLIGNVNNSKRTTPLDARKIDVESRLRDKYAGFSRANFLSIDTLNAYKNYYKKFKKTYHVQLQLESVVLKGKSLPNVTPLVDANFASEMETLLLTAGHDADLLEGPISIGVTNGSEYFTQINGNLKMLKAGDMMMKDEKGVVCSIIYGQDKRTPISPKTKRALYVTYVPEGIPRETVISHLDRIKENIFLFAPDAEIEYQEVLSA